MTVDFLNQTRPKINRRCLAVYFINRTNFLYSRPFLNITMTFSAFRFAAWCFLFIALGLSSFAQDSQITLDQIWKQGTYRTKGITGIRSMNDGLHYTATTGKGKDQYILKYSYQSGAATDTLLRSSDLKWLGSAIAFDSYSFNSDEKKLLLGSETESIYRHSSKSNYFVFDIGSKAIVPIDYPGESKQSLADLSPQSDKVAFVRDNDLYLTDLTKGTTDALTTDGKSGAIINGAVDWVYEEEFSFDKGFHWSPDGKYIAYYRFDESAVKEFSLTYYQELYPTTYSYKYPKAGEENSKVAIYVVEIATGKHTNLTDLWAGEYEYIPRIKWSPSNQLCFMAMNRHQSTLNFVIAEPTKEGWKLEEIYSETSDTYIDINDNLIFLKDGNHFIWNSERDGWNHIYVFNFKGKLVAQLTAGSWEVIDFYGVDEVNGKIFFSAAINGPTETEIYSLAYAKNLKSASKSGKAFKATGATSKYLTKLSPTTGRHNAFFSESYAYYILQSSAWNSPPTFALYNASGAKIRDLETNTELRDKVAAMDLPAKEFGTFQTPNGDVLSYWMIKPTNFDSTKAYPAMFFIYGGPGSNTVDNEWGGNDFFWHQMLAAEGYVIISVDPRGTMYKGKDFKHTTYKELGKYETQDMVASAQYFGALPFIDKDRIGMMGWSYGGYLTSLCMTVGAPYFKMGIAVAPVTNWRYYDSIYTERFMQTPQENASGYDDNSPINHVEKLQGAYLLVHGSADDNVHYQNTMEMINALVAADKQFDLFIYPNKNHGIYGGNTRYHLYNKMTNFIRENL